MEKNTKILLITLVCVLVVALITTTALAVALCMDNSGCRDSGGSARGKNQKAPSDNGTFGQPPAGRNNGENNLDGGPLAGRGILGQELEKVASTLGISADELLSQLKGGKTLAQIAGDKGVPTQTLVDTILEPVKQLLSNQVQNGRITQEQADQRLQQLTTRIEDFINNGGPLRGLRNGQNGQQTQSSATSSSTI